MIRSGLAWIFLGYVLLSATKGVHVSIIQKSGLWAWQTLLFYCFAMVTVGALSMNAGNMRQLFSLVRVGRRQVLEINIASAVMWATYFYAAKLGDPTIYAAVALGGGPTILLLWGVFTGNSSSLEDWLRSVIFTLGVILLVVPSLKFGLINASCAALGVGGGVGVIWMVKTNGKMTQAQWTPSQVLSVRFWGLVLVTGLLLLFAAAPRVPSSGVGWIHLAAIVVYGQFLALYSLHHGIGILVPKGTSTEAKQRGLQAISVTMASMPILMFFLQVAMAKAAFSISSFIGVCLIFACKIPYEMLGITAQTRRQGE